MRACDAGNFKNLSIALQTEDVNFSTEKEKLTALAISARAGNSFFCEFLVNKLANFSPDRRGWTPLHWSAIGGHESCLEFFCKNFQAQIDQKDSEGNTALFWAEKNGKRGCVKILTDFGADPSIRNFQGGTPAEAAAASAAQAR